MTTLSHHHRATYDAILAHPAPHNLHWRDVRSMLDALAQTNEEPNGNTRVTRNGHTLILHPDSHKDVGSPEQLKSLRTFLESSNEGAAPSESRGAHLLVVIDHREARVYQTERRGTAPQSIKPYDPNGDGRHLHYVQNDSNGQRRPELRSFYDAVAKSLQGAESILLFGGGTGSASAMDHLLEHLKAHNKDLAARVIGSVAIDEHHMTEDQLLAKARDFESAPSPTTSA